MLAIAQAGQQFHYISWTPTTTRPLVNGYGIKSFNKTDLSSTNFYNLLFLELIEKYKITIPRIYLSLDLDSVYLSEKNTADRNYALAYFMQETNDEKNKGLINLINYQYQKVF